MMTTITVDTSALYADEERLEAAIRRVLRFLVARVREADEVAEQEIDDVYLGRVTNAP